jgi:hypothetical protein
MQRLFVRLISLSCKCKACLCDCSVCPVNATTVCATAQFPLRSTQSWVLDSTQRSRTRRPFVTFWYQCYARLELSVVLPNTYTRYLNGWLFLLACTLTKLKPLGPVGLVVSTVTFLFEQPWVRSQLFPLYQDKKVTRSLLNNASSTSNYGIKC